MLLVRTILVKRVTVTKKGIFGKRKVLELIDENGQIGLACDGNAVEIALRGPHQLFSLSNCDIEFVPK